MTRPILLIALTILPLVSYSQPNIRETRLIDGRGDFDSFYDVYRSDDNGFALCGQTIQNNSSGFWLVKTSENGEVSWQRSYFSQQNPSNDIAYTLIELDDGGFVLGGRSGEAGQLPVDFSVMRTTARGEPVWWHTYNDEFANLGNCFAVIESKNGGILCVGEAVVENSLKRAYALMIDLNGNAIWENYYGQRGAFYGVREVPNEGFLCAGKDLTNQNSGWLVMINERGDTLWTRNFSSNIRCISTSINSRYGCSGSVGDGWSILNVSGEGIENWSNVLDMQNNNDIHSNCAATVAMGDGGYTLCGITATNNPCVVRVDGDGNELWRRFDHFGFGERLSEEFTGIITGRNDAIVVVGRAFNNANNTYDGLLFSLHPESSPPYIIQWEPIDTFLETLAGVRILFRVWANDIQEDSILYRWSVDGTDTSFSDSLSLTFESIADYNITCKVDDGQPGDSITWHVSVRDLFIAEQSPDTLSLSLRRGASQEFAIDSVAVVGGEPVEYQWTVTDLNSQEREDAGTEAGATVEFLRSGNYAVEGLAYRGESSDNVVWTVAVRSAILDFWPRELSLSVMPDSLVSFEVWPFNPESDSLQYRWEVDGDSVGGEATMEWSFAPKDSGQAGRSTYMVMAIVMDGVEGDTVAWTVSVRDPNSTPPTPPSIEGGENPVTFGFVSVSPNPFNSTTTIRFATTGGDARSTRLTLHDLMGREVRECVSASVRAGEHSYVLNGADLPAGIYWVRLEAGGVSRIAKVVMVR